MADKIYIYFPWLVHALSLSLSLHNIDARRCINDSRRWLDSSEFLPPNAQIGFDSNLVLRCEKRQHVVDATQREVQCCIVDPPLHSCAHETQAMSVCLYDE